MTVPEKRWAYEAGIGSGQRMHAVLAGRLPTPVERAKNVYTTLCGQRVSGARVYSTAFIQRDPSIKRCKRCWSVLQRVGEG
jgi:hypothetical protein